MIDLGIAWVLSAPRGWWVFVWSPEHLARGEMKGRLFEVPYRTGVPEYVNVRRAA